jgi:hypothetical protein
MRAEDQLPLAISMVIRTEYRGQRYSMGSSDPLPAGFEIRFGSLNFQATGNGYLMRITNRNEHHPWRSTGPGPVPVTPGADPSAPVQIDATGPTTRRDHWRDGDHSRGGARGSRAAVPSRHAQRRDGVRLICQHRRSGARGSFWPPCPGGQGPHHHQQRRVLPRSASELPPTTSHGYVEWDFSGVPDPVMFQRFLDVADY